MAILYYYDEEGATLQEALSLGVVALYVQRVSPWGRGMEQQQQQQQQDTHNTQQLRDMLSINQPSGGGHNLLSLSLLRPLQRAFSLPMPGKRPPSRDPINIIKLTLSLSLLALGEERKEGRKEGRKEEDEVDLQNESIKGVRE